jgi:FlaA1/EpsC-like NDP-sugar epimerase/lipopolysaccharide/colanic/teichoic acid biosynthesis glycosyltransferase
MLKRLTDFILSIAGLILLSPLCALIALWIKQDSPGPVLYWSERAGKDGKRFKIAKFRTMVVDAERRGPGITRGDDDRITGSGRWLRQYRLDEIPQLWNVLKGEMSLVGPRPEAPKYVARYTPEQSQVLSVKPGITGMTQLNYKDEASLLIGPDWEERYFHQVMPAKLAMDLEYTRRQSFWGDVKILFQTIYRLLYPYTQEKQPQLLGRHLLLIDTLLIMLAYILSFALRFDNIDFWRVLLLFTRQLFLFLAIKLYIFYRFGLYRRVWRYASIRELIAIFGAMTVSSTLIAILMLVLWVLPFSWSPVAGFPRSVLGIDWLMTLLLVGGFRFTLRAINEFSPPGEPLLSLAGNQQAARRIFIIGTDKSVARIAREIQAHPTPGYEIVGLITNSPNQVGLSIHNLPVRGQVHDLTRLVEQYRVNELIIAAPEVGGDLTRRVLQATEQTNLFIKTLPSYHNLISEGGLTAARSIQIEDLLRRDPIVTDVDRIAGYINGRKVLVTGAGGSIGSELCRQISNFGPSNVILLGHGENSIFYIQQDLKRDYPSVNFIPVISDIRDFGRMSRLLAMYQPDIIFHAAAHKHVPMMELNPEEGVINNVLGTKVLLEAAEAMEIPRLVMISSDKAVDPANIMGATKRTAEMIVQAVAGRARRGYVVVRFGNVLGSRGSVIPTFQRQIAGGGPVTITHPDMTRYFMTIPEAVQLVIQAAVLGHGGEVFVLNMGQPVRILDLAHDLIRLSGLRPGSDIGIAFTGLRPGEKLTEALFTEAESPTVTEHENILVIPPQPNSNGLFWQQVESLVRAAYQGDVPGVRRLLEEIVPGAELCP